MKVIIDKRKSNAIYVDKSNNHIANVDNIIKLTFTDNSATIDKYIAIIAGVYKLNETEVAVLKYIITDKYNSLSGQVCITVAKIINKSTATIARAIDSLRTKKLIYGNGANALKVSTSIDVNNEALSNAKFVVIELHPEVTSNGVSI
ncbi:MAG: plasmid replication protein [Bacteriophage sp.]|nr:MAG: plasmid replication protein [Bacteriophage sp.]